MKLNRFHHNDNNINISFNSTKNQISFNQSLSLVSDDSEQNFEGDEDLDKNLILNNIYKEKDLYLLNDISNNNTVKLDCLSAQHSNSFINSTNENKIKFLFDYKLGYFIEDNQTIFYKKEKIFHITKTNKKIGRIKKSSCLIGKHNKLSKDNIIRKIKGRFIEKLRLYINSEYKNYLLNKYLKKNKYNNFLKKINPKVSRKIKKEENLEWFKSKIYEVFSQNLSLRYSSFSPDSNKKKIIRLMSMKEPKGVIDILNMDIQTLFDKYINDEEIPGFKTLKDDLKELETQMNNEKQENIKEYLKHYEYIAKNMKKIINEKGVRSKKPEH